MTAPDMWHHHDTWADHAACRNHPHPEWWFPLTCVRKEVLRICHTCPVRDDCLNHALTKPEEHGVWGGKSHRQRDALLRRWGIKPATAHVRIPAA